MHFQTVYLICLDPCINLSYFFAEKIDREGGKPLEINVKKQDSKGFFSKQEWGYSNFIAPFVYRSSTDPLPEQEHEYPAPAASDKVIDFKENLHVSGFFLFRVTCSVYLTLWFCIQAALSKRRLSLIFICIPVSPGRSRLIWTFPRNFGVFIDKIVPRWVFHIGQNTILDSDLHLLHVEVIPSLSNTHTVVSRGGSMYWTDLYYVTECVQERKILERGPKNWQKACFIPTKSDANVVTFRRWFNKYSGAQVDWRGKFDPSLLPPTPPREQLFDRLLYLPCEF